MSFKYIWWKVLLLALMVVGLLYLAVYFADVEAKTRLEGGTGKVSMRYRESAIDTSGCVLWLKMNEGSGDTAYDASSAENDGVRHGATWTENGYSYGGLSFDGVDDYVDCGSDSSLDLTSDFSVEMWIKVSSLESAQKLYYRGTWEQGGFEFDLNTAGSIQLYTWQSGANQLSISTAGDIVVNEWTHVVAIKDGTSVKFYKNGDELTLGTTGTHTNCASISADAIIGIHGVDLSSGPFNGSIDEVRIYNRALSAEEIRQHYQKGVRFE